MLFLVALLVALPGSYGSTSQDEIQSSLMFNQIVLADLLAEKAKCEDKTKTDIRNVTDDVISHLKNIHEELKSDFFSQVLDAISGLESKLKGEFSESLREVMGERSHQPDPDQTHTLRTQSTKIQQLEGITQEQITKIASQDVALRDLKAKLQREERNLLEQKKLTHSKNQKVRELEAQLRQQEAKIQTQEEKIQTQEEKIQTQEAKIQTQEEKVQTQEAKIQTQEAKIQTQEEKVQTQEEKIQAQEQEIQQLSEEVRELKGQHETENVPSTTVVTPSTTVKTPTTTVETPRERNETVVQQEDELALDCSDYWKQNKRQSGRYTIFPVRGRPGVDVWCDMTADGPSTVILSRSPQPHQENFVRSWEEYKAGFGNASTEYWLGLDALHAITSRTPHILKVQIQDIDGQFHYGGLRKFVVSDEDSQYEVLMEDAYGIGNSLLASNGKKFSTTDHDNDGSFVNCAQSHGGGGWWYGRGQVYGGGIWWYSACTVVYPTGEVAESGHGPRSMNWPSEQIKRYIFLKRAVMRIQPRKTVIL